MDLQDFDVPASIPEEALSEEACVSLIGAPRWSGPEDAPLAAKLLKIALVAARTWPTMPRGYVLARYDAFAHPNEWRFSVLAIDGSEMAVAGRWRDIGHEWTRLERCAKRWAM